jgi:peroxiredoxin
MHMKAFILALALVSLFQGLGYTQMVGQNAPEFTASTVEGNELSLSSLRGQTVIIAFWAAWCTPCKRNMPDLRALQQKHAPAGLVIVPVGMSPEREADMAWLRNNGYSFQYALFTGGWKTAPWYAVTAIPWMAVIDRSGIIRWTGHSNIPENVITQALKPARP